MSSMPARPSSALALCVAAAAALHIGVTATPKIEHVVVLVMENR